MVIFEASLRPEREGLTTGQKLLQAEGLFLIVPSGLTSRSNGPQLEPSL